MASAQSHITNTAADQMGKRQSAEDDVKRVLADPLEVLSVRPGRVVLHGMLDADPQNQPYLLRVFVDVEPDPPQVVTAYRTSKIDKYRSQP